MNHHFFSNNRKKIMTTLGGGVLIITGYTKMQSMGDTAHPFRQEANFWYLTGIESPDWRLILDGNQGESWLIAPEIDAVHQTFDGSLNPPAAKDISGVDAVLNRQEGERLLQNIAKKHTDVYTLGVPLHLEHADFALNPARESLYEELEKLFREVRDCQKELAQLRAVKQLDEIKCIQEVATISVEAFKKVKDTLPSYRHEYEIDAELGYYFRRHNAIHAFEPIVASGKNACTLHYAHNSSELRPDNFVLIDAGARMSSYSGDITRTFAIGEPTERQRAVHKTVQAAEQEIITLLKPGLLLKDYHASVDRIMEDALLSLGLMKTENDQAAYRRYFPHAVSHGLGLDVHEGLGGYKELRAGMVLTVEPGIYIPEEDIGVRIEDTILITDNGHENLTAGISTDL